MMRYLKFATLISLLFAFTGCGGDNNVVILRYLQGGSIQGLPANPSGVVTTLAGTAGVTGTVDGTGTAARFTNPLGITTDGANLYVTDYTANVIRKIVISTGVVTTLAGSGTPGSADGTGTAATFSGPGGITTDGTNLYVCDYTSQTVRKIVIATGVVTTLAGTAGVTGATDGTGAAASFSGPAGITTDGTNLYVGEQGNNDIRKIVIATGVVTTLAGSGTAGAADGTGTAATFSGPDALTTDGINLYVAEYVNNTIRKVVIATGVVTTIAGDAAAPAGTVDGTGTAANFNSPIGITTDGTNLFIAEQTGNVIRKMVLSTGVVTTLAGSPGVAGSTDGTGAAALFDRPFGITTDGTNLYVADYNNSTIRKIQ